MTDLIDSLTWRNAVNGVGILVLIYLVFKIFTPLLDFKIYLDWWAQYGGGSYHNCIDFVALAYWEHFPLYYHIRNQTQSEARHFASSAWVYFLTSLIFGGAVGIVPGGVVSPRSICETIVPRYPPSVPNKKWPVQTECDSSGDPWSCWKSLIMEWGGVKIDHQAKDYTFDMDKWTSPVNRDNFFFHDYAIPIDSPLMIGFLTNWSSDRNNNVLYPTAMLPLLGKTAGAAGGGWWGYLQQMGDQPSYNELNRYIWADDQTPYSKAEAKKNCGSASSQVSSIMGGANMAIAGAFVNPALAVGGFVAGYVGTEAGKGCTPFTGQPGCVIM